MAAILTESGNDQLALKAWERFPGDLSSQSKCPGADEYTLRKAGRQPHCSLDQ